MCLIAWCCSLTSFSCREEQSQQRYLKTFRLTYHEQSDDVLHSFQFWDFIDTFGNLGMRSCDYFDTDIIFDDRYFEPFVFE